MGEGGTAIQASGDVTITGMSAQDALAIIDYANKNALAHYTAEARSTVEKLFEELSEKLVDRLFTPGEGNPEALRDPDFQFLIGEAKESYARSGDPAVAETLVDIIARRSEAKTHSREALTLNEAAVRAPRLTKPEFAELSLAYLIRHTAENTITNLGLFHAYLTGKLMPFVDNISLDSPSYWHIEAQGCGRLNSISRLSFHSALVQRYGGFLGRGSTLAELENNAPEGSKHLVKEIVVPCLRDHAKFQPNAANQAVLEATVKAKGWEAQLAIGVWSQYASTIPPSDDELIAMLKPDVPGIEKLFKVWAEGPFASLELNSVGIAIGHANAVRVVGFNAPLSLWIK